MSQQEREVLIEYIRLVRDHQVLLERIAKYIDSANTRATDVITSYFNDLGTKTEINRAPVPSSNRILSRNTTLTTVHNMRRPQTIPPPPPPPTESPLPTESPPPPRQPPPPPSTHPYVRNNIESITTTVAEPATTQNRTLSPINSTTIRNMLNSSSYSTRLPGTPDDPTLYRIRRFVHNQLPSLTSNINIPSDIPPGLNRVTTTRRRSTAPARTQRARRRVGPYNIDTSDNERAPRDIGSPVRIRPNVTQIRTSTELLKWEDISGNYQEVCPISMQSFIDGDDIMRIKSCQHIFREMNLRHWFRYSPRCPICRYDIRDWVP
jgi:hypothetical protein